MDDNDNHDSAIDPHQNKIMDIERVDNKNEGKEIEGVYAENEGMDNDSLTPEWKVYFLWNPPTINYNDGRTNRRSMWWINPIVGSHAPHNVYKAQVNVGNAIITFFEPNSPKNIIIN